MIRFNLTDETILTGTQFVHEWVHCLQDAGHDIVDASRGKPSFPIDEAIIDAMQAALLKTTGDVFPYGTDALGEPHFRKIVADSLSEIYQTPLKAKHIIFTPGGQFCLYLIFKILFQRCPDGVFVSTNPGYLNYQELIQYATEHNDSLFHVNLKAENNYRYDADTLEDALKQNDRPIAAFVFCHPLNPTGQVITTSQWQAFAEVLHQYDAPIIMDEAFFEVIFDEGNRCSLLQVDPTLKERIILLRSGTKALGFPGERLCTAIIPEWLIETFRYHQSRLLGNPPILAQTGMAEAIKQLTPSKLDALSDYYGANAKKLMRALDDMIGPDHYIKPEGGFFLLADFSHLIGSPMPLKAKQVMHLSHDTIRTDHDIMAAFMLGMFDDYDKGVALIPGSYFGLPEQDGIMRISYSITPDDIDEVTDRLKIMCTRTTTDIKRVNA